MLVLYAIAIFVGAALLFAVQPMVARMVLPVLGGSPAVWNTAMVFFQAVLLGGYLYAHVLTRRLGARGQLAVHAVALLLPLLVLPIALPAWTPPPSRFPAGWVLLVLLVSVGAPFFVVSTTGPLLQRWFSRTAHRSARDPYFLYAASNAGSLIALLGYPLLLEPVIGLRAQTAAWSIGYFAFVALVIACGAAQLRRPAPAEVVEVEAGSPTEAEDRPLTRQRRLLWIALAFVPSTLMLAVTQHVSTDIAAVPLLWVVPLSIYLLTFIMAFAARARMPLASSAKLYPIVGCAVVVAFLLHAREPAPVLIGMHLLLLFIGALVCHTRLADDRPSPEHLTEFYLLVALGGVLGGAFNALVAPVVFSQLVEYPIAIVLVALLLPRTGLGPRFELAWMRRAPRAWGRAEGALAVVAVGVFLFVVAWVLDSYRAHGLVPDLLLYGVPVVACYLASKRPLRFAGILAVLLLFAETQVRREADVVLQERTFFGAYRVLDERATGHHPHQFRLMHGTTSHGIQAVEPPHVFEPTGYYAETGPMGEAMAFARQGRGPQHAGLIGLGVGTLAAYARPGDRYTYYEIDPAIVDIATDRRFFSYLKNAMNRGAAVDWIIGDARQTLGDAEPGGLDVIVVDAFTSDAIPIHLLTTEAVELYMSRLAPDGLLMMHLSNLHLDLEPVVAAIADRLGLQALLARDSRPDAEEQGEWPDGTPVFDPVSRSPSTWVVLARPDRDLSALRRMGVEGGLGWWREPETRPGVRAWTDDFAGIIRVFMWQ